MNVYHSVSIVLVGSSFSDTPSHIILNCSASTSDRHASVFPMCLWKVHVIAFLPSVRFLWTQKRTPGRVIVKLSTHWTCFSRAWSTKQDQACWTRFFMIDLKIMCTLCIGTSVATRTLWWHKHRRRCSFVCKSSRKICYQMKHIIYNILYLVNHET